MFSQLSPPHAFHVIEEQYFADAFNIKSINVKQLPPDSDAYPDRQPTEALVMTEAQGSGITLPNTITENRTSVILLDSSQPTARGSVRTKGHINESRVNLVKMMDAH